MTEFVRHNMQGILVNKYQINIIDKYFKIFRRIMINMRLLLSIGEIGKGFIEKLRLILTQKGTSESYMRTTAIAMQNR